MIHLTHSVLHTPPPDLKKSTAEGNEVEKSVEK
jgi:hypothetical protein